MPPSRRGPRPGHPVILDGVYSHTGSNSLYFNREGAFPSVGAYNSKESPYYSWYTFYNWPNVYHSWWDFDTLPTVNKMDPAFVRYIITDEDSVLAHWLRLGADGYRLDVADELPDEFIKLLRNRIKELNPDALLLGEVWEDASNKCAYGKRRTYFTGGELDSVMNYPFRTAIVNFVKNLDGGRGFKETVMSIMENYPPQVAACNMNLLGTHDTPPRILTALVDDFDGSGKKGQAPSVPEPAAGGRGAAADGLLPAIHPAGQPQPVLRRRGRDGGLPRPLQPPHLPMGAGGPGASGPFPPSGAAAENL